MKTRTTSSMLIKAIVPVGDSLNRWPWRRGILFIPLALALAWLALPRTALAVRPPPDGGYANQNTAEGQDALFSLTTGVNNTAMGFNALFRNATGSANTASGFAALFSNTTGFANSAIGVSALTSNTTGSNNTASGLAALASNTTGSYNTANGVSALFSNTTGTNNTANGFNALSNNTTGFANTANGVSALLSNTTGGFNTANGVQALTSNTTGNGNAANGNFALFSNTEGSSNTADGFDALFNNTSGSGNIALGLGAGGNLTTGNNNIDIGNVGVTGEANTIRIGAPGTQTKTFIVGIRGMAVPNGVGVIVGANGKLGTIVSSAQFKDEIKPMNQASEAILALQPVTFRYKEEFDPEGIPQFGLVAEQVEKVNPNLVARDEEGKPYTVRYEAVNAMLLNEFLKEHHKVEEQAQINQRQETTIGQQQKDIQALAATVKEQAAQIQKVTVQLAAIQPAARLVTKK